MTDDDTRARSISTDDFSAPAAYGTAPLPHWVIGPFHRDETLTFVQPAAWADPTGTGWTSGSVYNPTLGIAPGADGVATLHLVYRCSPRKEGMSSRIGHAVLTADGWVDDGGPVLWPTLPNEALGVEDPKLYRAEGRWFLFYNGVWDTAAEPDRARFRSGSSAVQDVGCDIMLAVSDDLVTWTKLGQVVPDDVAHLWAKGAVIPRDDRGRAVRIRGEYLMYVSEGCGGLLTVGHSTDMEHWRFTHEDYLDISALGPQLYEVACAVVSDEHPDELVLDLFHRAPDGAFAAAQARYDIATPFTQRELHRGGSLAWGGLLRWDGDRVFMQGWDAPPDSRELYAYRAARATERTDR